MMNLQQVMDYWVRPACSYLPEDYYGENLNTPARWQFVTGIGNCESGYKDIVQDGCGIAKSFWQIQPATYNDLFVNFLSYRPELLNAVNTMLRRSPNDGTPPPDELLLYNMRFAALICALIVYRSPLALPQLGDTNAQVDFWLQSYNTREGAGTYDRAYPCFKEVACLQ
ncbi:MAG: hypothetical protein IIZ94_07230 [Prevotella sp.]|nr:hypothetical protein [Prevotella sp.]